MNSLGVSVRIFGLPTEEQLAENMAKESGGR